jgi:transcriptional regulator with XRE-family HTH domain
MAGGRLGEALRRRREELGLSQSQLGALMGATQNDVSQWETGRVKLPEAAARRELARVLGYTHLELLVLAGELSQEEAAQRERGPSEVETLLAELSEADQGFALEMVRALARTRRERRLRGAARANGSGGRR